MATGETQLIDVSLIDNPGRDARMGHEMSEFDDLVISIRENGVLQPILVRPRGDRFEVIAGNRRLHAARKLGLPKIPALVRIASDAETAIFRFEENLKRADINVVEEARYIAESITALGLSTADFASKINRSTEWVENRLAVAGMPDYLQKYLMDKQITLGAALWLNEISEDRVRRDWSYHAATQGTSILAAENAYYQWKKIDDMRREDPTRADLPLLSEAPPVIMRTCERCGAQREASQTKFVSICADGCAHLQGGEGN